MKGRRLAGRSWEVVVNCECRLARGPLVVVLGRFEAGAPASVESVRRLLRSLEPIVPFPSSIAMFSMVAPVSARKILISMRPFKNVER